MLSRGRTTYMKVPIFSEFGLNDWKEGFTKEAQRERQMTQMIKISQPRYEKG